MALSDFHNSCTSVPYSLSLRVAQKACLNKKIYIEITFVAQQNYVSHKNIYQQKQLCDTQKRDLCRLICLV